MLNKRLILFYMENVMKHSSENMRIEAVMHAARSSGFLDDKSRRLGVRVSPKLVEQAKKQTGIETDTDLVQFALASLAVEDNYWQTLAELRGTVDPDVDLSF